MKKLYSFRLENNPFSLKKLQVLLFIHFLLEDNSTLFNIQTETKGQLKKQMRLKTVHVRTSVSTYVLAPF